MKMTKILFILVAFAAFFSCSVASAFSCERYEYDVVKNNKTIGAQSFTVFAHEDGTKEIYSQLHAKVRVFFIKIEFSLASHAVYRNGRLLWYTHVHSIDDDIKNIFYDAITSTVVVNGQVKDYMPANLQSIHPFNLDKTQEFSLITELGKVVNVKFTAEGDRILEDLGFSQRVEYAEVTSNEDGGRKLSYDPETGVLLLGEYRIKGRTVQFIRQRHDESHQAMVQNNQALGCSTQLTLGALPQERGNISGS